MFRCLVMLVSVLFVNMAIAKPICTTEGTPRVVRNLENYTIIANHDDTIKVAHVFDGKALRYSVRYHVKNSANKIKIDSKTGIITIKAAKKDNFDIYVSAKNPCGIAKTNFNVQIDEEE